MTVKSALLLGRLAGFAGVLAITPAAFASGAPDRTRIPELQRSLRAQEYHASPNSQGLQAPNRAHNFRAYFDAAGLRLVDRTAPGSPEIAHLVLAGIGRDNEADALASAELSTVSGRVERDRPGVHEWFENSEAGLVHGLRLSAKPGGSGPLHVALRLASGDAQGVDGGIEIRGGGRRVRLTRLPVTDAGGRLLASRLETDGAQGIRLVVEDAAALYPITAELLFTGSADHSYEIHQLEAFLGISVAAAGDVNGDGYGDLIVGAFRYDSGEDDEGAAFVFDGGPNGIADLDGPVFPDAILQSNQVNARMGLSVAGAGDVNGDGYDDIIIGAAQWEDDVATEDEGAAFVFHGAAFGVGAGSPANADAVLEGDQVTALFGYSVAGVGDVDGDGYADVAVGAPFYFTGQTQEGAGSLFLGSGAGIPDGSPDTDAFTMLQNVAFANLGHSIAAAGDVNGDGFADIIIGAPYYETAGFTDEGGAFLYLGDSTPANLVTITTLRAAQDFAFAGWSVGGAGDVNGDGYSDVIVGMPNYDNPDGDEGEAMVFHGSNLAIASGTPATANTIIQSNQGGAFLGNSVAMIGDTDGDGYADVAVGAPGYDGEGAVFVFLGRAVEMPNGRPNNAAATLQVGQATADFGWSVAGAGDVNGDGYADLVAGAPEWTNGHTDEGAVFVYHGGAAGVDSAGPAGATSAIENSQLDALFGSSVAGAGDVNGDGYGDLIIGAPAYDDGQNNEGAAFVFLGGPNGAASGDETAASATLQSNQENAFFGTSVAGAGDVDGDGYGDVVIGAYGYDDGEDGEGAAFIFEGGASGIADGDPTTADAVLQSNQDGASMGTSVAGAGDINGDGFGDVAIGAWFYDPGGAVFLFHGGSSGVADGDPATADTVLASAQLASFFGYSVAGAGDTNGDGYADLVVGAFAYDHPETTEGAAFVFHGGAGGVPSGDETTASALLESDQASAEFGVSVAAAGDTNGDGYADVIVGAEDFDSLESNEGAAFVFLGGAGGVVAGGPAAAAAILESDQVDAHLGTSVAGAGDVNGDGYADVLVGAPYYDDGASNEGAAFVFLGGAGGVASGGPAGASAVLQSNQDFALMGKGVAGAGDVDGDGFADVLVGAYLTDGAGAAYVFAGNDDGDGRQVLPRQLRGGGSSVPVQPWGSTIAPEEFQVELTNTDPAGRGRVKLEVEVCPLALPFGDAGCTRQVSPTWSDSTASAAGLTLTETIGDLPPGLLRWRARTLHAPFRVTEPGITAPANPSHGPWRRYLGQAFEADLRTPQGLFYTLTPCRVVDTRAGSGAPIGGPALSSGVERPLTLRGPCELSDHAVAVSVSITVVSPTGAGELVFYPLAGQVPVASHLSFGANQTRANNAVLGLDALGVIRVMATMTNPGDTVDLLVDINGEFR